MVHSKDVQILPSSLSKSNRLPYGTASDTQVRNILLNLLAPSSGNLPAAAVAIAFLLAMAFRRISMVSSKLLVEMDVKLRRVPGHRHCEVQKVR